MAFNVVYSDKDRIQGAIESGVIPRESLVLTSCSMLAPPNLSVIP